jgi:hypothetical protein
MTIEIKDIPAALVDIHTKLVEKLGGQPWTYTSLYCNNSGVWSIDLWSEDVSDNAISHIEGDNPTNAIKAALDFIAGMLSKEEQRVVDWGNAQAKLIDDGHSLNLPDEVMAPLRESRKAMTENLLTVTK